MTELIVALDDPNPLTTFRVLVWHGVEWFKLGPQGVVTNQWDTITHSPEVEQGKVKLFLDLKLTDTRDTVWEAVRRMADAGVAAVSVYSEVAAEAAWEASQGSPLRVWQVLNLSDERSPLNFQFMPRAARCHGVICSGPLAEPTYAGVPDKIVPGVRLAGDPADGHRWVTTPTRCKEIGATHAVVGRSITRRRDPGATAKEFMAELA